MPVQEHYSHGRAGRGGALGADDASPVRPHGDPVQVSEPRRVRRVRGFTLIELMVAIAVLTILVTLGVPAMRDFVLNSRRASLTNELLFSMQLARSESIKRGMNVAVCASTDGDTCSGNAAHWTQGWIVQVQEADGTPIEVIYEGQVEAAGNTVTTPRPNFTFRPFATATNDTITVCDSRGAGHARAVVIAPSGRSRVAEPGDETLACPT